MQRLLKIIQQRKLDRVAAAYGVTAWLIVQGASIALPAFGAPVWVMKVVIALAVLGFPLALWIAWQVTVSPYNQFARTRSTATDIALLAFLGIVIALTGAELLSGKASWRSAPKSAPVTRLPPGNAPPKTAIAVLPFLNMSGDASKDYFSDGISEELLNQLANMPALRVAARTSSFAFKGKAEDIRTIARALNVRSVLEGSVREDGQHVRITAQLIDAANGYHIWSKTFDRDLSNILALEDEIARAITVSLTHGLLGSSASARPRITISPEAYRQYLQAQSLAAHKTAEDDARAIALFEKVTQAQPGFAPAFAALGRTYLHLAQFENERPADLLKAEAALDTALRLDPKNLEALSSHLFITLTKWDWQMAASDAQRLQALNPHNVFTLRALSYYYGSLGFSEQQAAVLREATRLDPLSFVDLNNLAVVYLNRGDYAEAASAASDALSLMPKRALSLYTLCAANAGMKRIKEVQTLAGQLSSSGASDAGQACLLQFDASAGRKTDAHRIAESLASRFPVFTFDEAELAGLYLLTGDMRTASAWFARAYDKRNRDLFATPYYATTPPSLAQSREWKTMMQRPEARAWLAARNKLEKELSAG